MTYHCRAMQLNFNDIKKEWENGHIGAITHTSTQTAYQVAAEYFAPLP